jgi:hypothetical protein
LGSPVPPGEPFSSKDFASPARLNVRTWLHEKGAPDAARHVLAKKNRPDWAVQVQGRNYNVLTIANAYVERIKIESNG